MNKKANLDIAKLVTILIIAIVFLVILFKMIGFGNAEINTSIGILQTQGGSP